MRRIFTVLAMLCFSLNLCQAQNQVNPASQVRWPAVTGIIDPVAPAWPCAAGNYGQPYTNTATGKLFVCAASGWVASNTSGLNPGLQSQLVQYPANGIIGGPTSLTTDTATGRNLTVPGAVTSAVDNNIWQAASPGVSGIQSTINSAGTTGAVVIPANLPALMPAPTYGNPSTVSSTGGTLGPGTYSYLVCSVDNNQVEQKCSTTAIGSSAGVNSITITSGTTNMINIGFQVTGATYYNLYGRVAGHWGFIKQLVIGQWNNFNDTGTALGAAPKINYSNPNGIMVDDLRKGVIAHFATGVPASEFGCAEDGATDDTACLQAAINYAVSSGINVVDLTPGKTYLAGLIGGTIPLPWDNGACPAVGGTTVNGAACTNLAAEAQTQQAYTLLIPSNITINFHGATIKGNFGSPVSATINPATTPVMFACTTAATVINDGIPEYAACNNVTLNGGQGGISNSFIPIWVPGGLFFSHFNNLTFGGAGITMLIHVWDSSFMSDINIGYADAGVIIGGWYTNRANNLVSMPGPYTESGGYADGLVVNNLRYSGSGAFLTNHSYVDAYFDTYIYKSQEATNGRMVDVQGTSSPTGPQGFNTILPDRGVFGSALMVYNRYGRPNNGPYITNLQAKFATRYDLYEGGIFLGGSINNVGFEAQGQCYTSPSTVYVGDPVNCPDPYGAGGYAPAPIYFGQTQFMTIVSAGGGAAGYAQGISGLDPSDTVIGSQGAAGQSTAPSQTSIVGSNATGSGASFLQGTGGKLIFTRVISGDITHASTYSIGSEWDVQPNENASTAIGGLLDFSHTGSFSNTDFSVRLPYLTLGSNTRFTCDAPGTGYYGHDGQLSFVAGAPGTPDDISICEKDGTNTYSWRSLLPSIVNGAYNTDRYTTNPGNNGIANLFAGPCASANCLAAVPANSTDTEASPMPPAGSSIFDYRANSTLIKVHNPQLLPGGGVNCNQEYAVFCENYLFDNGPTAAARVGENVHDITATFNSDGWNYGNAPGAVVPLWAGAGLSAATVNINMSGITNVEGKTTYKHATGDFLSDRYIYGWSDCGAPDYSNEGCEGYVNQNGETSDFFNGFVGAGAATGTTSLPITYNSGYTPSNRNRNATTENSFMLDITKGTITGHVTGATTAAAGLNNVLSLPIDTAVTPSSASGNLSCTLSTTTPVLTTQTATCSVTGVTGTFTTGYAYIGGDFPEGTTISAVSGSGSTQTITFTYLHPHGSAVTTIWQGSNVMDQYISWDQSLSIDGFPLIYHVYGAIDSTHLAVESVDGGHTYNPYYAPQPLTNISRFGTTVTAIFQANNNGYNIFSHAASAVVAGCSDSTVNGTITNISFSTYTGVATWTSANSGTASCPNMTIQIPPSYEAFHLYPGAEVLTHAVSAPATITIGNNNVAWAAGDTIQEPHHPVVHADNIKTFTTVNNSNTNGGSTGTLFYYRGAGVNGSFHFLEMSNLNPCSWYKACGGWLDPPTAIHIGGYGSYSPNGGLAYLDEAPLPGHAVVTIGGPDAAIGGSGNTQPQLFAVYSASTDSQLFYYPATHAWGASNIAANQSLTVAGQNVCQANGTNCPAIPKGRATLVAGTATVSTAAASTSGNYTLTNCGASGTAIGTLSVGAVTAGTSFVINSLTATNTVATGDTSTVCWMIQ